MLMQPHCNCPLHAVSVATVLLYPRCLPFVHPICTGVRGPCWSCISPPTPGVPSGAQGTLPMSPVDWPKLQVVAVGNATRFMHQPPSLQRLSLRPPPPHGRELDQRLQPRGAFLDTTGNQITVARLRLTAEHRKTGTESVPQLP